MIDLDTSDFLDPAEIPGLISTIQATKTTRIDADGNVTVVYESAKESEAAFDTLLSAFKPLFKKLLRLRQYGRMSAEDAEGLLLVEFVSAIREHDPEGTPFLALIGTILSRRLSDANRTSGAIRVPENVGARYLALVKKHDGSVEAAYEECRTTANNFDPSTFLAVHRAYASIDSLDLDDDAEDGDGNPVFAESPHEQHATPGPEESLVQADLVRWLFTKVDHRKEQILRLSYGFEDIDTQNLRLAAGFRDNGEDLVMTDKQVAQVLGSSTQTVNRQRNTALRTMRESMQALVDEADAA